MTASYQVVCNQCDQVFTANTVETELDGGGLLTEMVCPHCSARYEIATVDAAGRRLAARLERLRRAGRGHTDEFNELMQRYRTHVTGPGQ